MRKMNMIRVDTETGRIAIDTEVWPTQSKVVITCGSSGVQIQYGDGEGSPKEPAATRNPIPAAWSVKRLAMRYFQFSST